MREKHVREREKERQGERQALCRGRAPERGRARLLERQRGSLRNREPARDRSYDNNRIYRRSRERGRDRDRRHEEYLPRCRSISRKTRQDETYGSSKGGNQEHNRQDAEPDQEVWTKVIRRREAKAAKKNYTQNRSLHNLSANHPNWRDKEDITSFYFTNFTDNVNEVRLWGKFKIWGDVREVFIAKRRNKEGRRFGFVRFKDVSDVKLLETHLDNIFIDDHKLFVNLPRFTRLASNVHTHTKVDKKEKQSKEAVKDSQATNRPRVRSYVEVVAQKGGLGGTTTAVDGIPTITIVPNKGREVWCKGAWVGRLKKPMQAEKMEDYISWELGYSISARSLGDDIVLITGLSADKAQQLINSETNGGNTLFYSLERWRPGYRVSNRIVWLQVWGFPIEAWEVDHMKQVVSTIGDVIEVDEDTEDRRRLDRARLLVRTPLPPAIIKETIVRCGEEDHRVWLVEEVGDGGDMRRTRLSMSGEWTDEVTSEEEGVAEEDDDGDTAFSYSPELSVTNNNFFLNHQSKVLPSGPCGQTRDRFESVDKSPNPDNCRPNAGGAARHSQGPTLTKADQGYVCAEEMQGNLSPVVITSEPELDVLRKSEEDQNGKVSNFEEPIGQQCITHGDYKTCATDRGDFYDTGHIQGQKNVGPSSTSGLITKLEECKKKKHITMTQTASRNMDGFPKVYARQRNGPLKGCLLKPVAEENTLDMEDKVVPDPKDSFTKGPLSRNRGEMEGEAEEVNSVDGNPLEDLEDANQQWTLAKSLGLQHASDQEGIHSFKNMETRDRKEALQLGNRSRGLKWTSIRSLVGKLHVDLLCLQETKKDCLDKASCQFLWGQSDLEWEWQPAINAAGGLLCIWDNNKFQTILRSFEMVSGLRINFSKSQFGALASKFIDHIHQIRLINNLHDTWIWRAESTGVLTSKSGYQVIKADRDDEGQYLGFKTLWEIKLPPKALSFGWRLLWDRLPTKDNLIKRQIQVDNNLCPFCHSQPETASHLFFTCGKIMPIWWEFLSWIKEEKVFHCRPLDNFLQHFSSAVSKDANIRRTMWWIAVTTSIWRLRNDIIFQNQTFDITRLTDSTLFLLWTWLRGWERNFQIPYYSWSSNMSIAFS
ncbi:hypothetical protein GmHk_16G045861 [Glycine max]|nr:hypothetical protein GmHk_16G045861 [Glycine max]